jgi:DNA polymerase/3'-5' exonuclease PolX
MKLEAAQRIAEKIKGALAPFCDRIEIAGSIRRQRPEVGDIDIVCQPKGEAGKQAIAARCLQGATFLKGGEQYLVFTLANGLQLDLWFAHAATGDLLGNGTPDNWVTLLICRTGSMEFNIELAKLAHSYGLHWNPHSGLYRNGEWLYVPTEEAFFDALGMAYVKPEDRK